MGIFNFLKKSSKKEEEIREFKLDELYLFVDSLSEKIIEDVDLSLVDIKEGVIKEKSEMMENIQKLSEAEIKNKNIPERARHMAIDNRTTCIQKINVLLQGTNPPNNFDEGLNFCDSFDEGLEHFNKGTMRSYQILPEFFPDEITKVSVNIKNLKEFVRKSRKLMEDSEIEKYNHLKSKINEIKQEIKQEKEINEEIELIEKDLQIKIKKINEKENNIKEIENGVEYKGFLSLVDKKKMLELEALEIEKRPLQYFFGIEPALKKYERLTLNHVIVKEYLADPLKALLKDKEFKIIEVIDKMKDSLLKNQFELKERKKEKILKELDNFTKDNFEMFLSKYAELNMELSRIELELGKITVIGELEEIKEEFNQGKIDLEEDKSKMEKMKGGLEMIDIDNLKRVLEIRVKENINENVRVV